MKRTIRFWHYGNEPVLIKMRAGQTLRHSSGGPTDEGWSRDTDVWTFDGRTVTHEWVSDGVDCDGRLTQYGESYFRACDAFAGNEVDGVRFPAWQQGEHGQRDYAAEAMGY
jgi:hypothetical protein